ncbi:DNA polymerase beta superfamily protein [Aestuariibius sp. 2305UL40-4]|uniref:nucleotidyltransferase domain-containing protein n=1 Tax=Aestuariibius violaceus TaxID=3234132 RepID=UPI00345F13E0
MTMPVGPEIQADILERLRQIEREEDARILLAVESGSRAWGFHSEDSDYDVRFIYTRPIDWHLSVRPGRDVIERPISDELDISGWDLRKTLGLILGSNAVALEWLQSPVRYREADGFSGALLEFAQHALRRKPVMWHYLRLAERQMERAHDKEGRLRLKKFFYALRPALALRWLRLRPETGVVPMAMDALVEGAGLDASLVHQIDALIEEKKAAEAALSEEAAEPLMTLVMAEIAEARDTLSTDTPETRPDSLIQADQFHIEWTRRAEGDIL